MSGILCVHNESGIPQDLPRYLAALRRLTHRGRDGEGSILRSSLFLGVRRDSPERGSAGKQPLTSTDCAIAFDGHVTNREGLAQSLRANGCQADLSSDAGLVLALYLEFGEQFVQRLRGVWALVVWDARDHRLLISRDRLGVRPLYYFRGAQHLVVASEIRSILPLDPAARTVDRQRIRDLVHDGLIDDWTGTCFAHIRPAPPGTIVNFRRGQLTTSRYWALRPSTDRRLDARVIREELIAAVRRHTPTDVKIGIALSGGIDSSSIAGILARSSRQGTRALHAFSIVPPHTADESSLIDATIRHTGLPHTYVPVEPLDYPRALAQLIDAHDEPIHYSGAFYQFVLRQRMAEAGCQAVLVGYGADEIFAGYRGLASAFLIALVVDGRPSAAVRFLRGAEDFLGLPRRGIINTALGYARMRARTASIEALKRTVAYQMYRSRTRDRARAPDLSDVLAGSDEVGGSTARRYTSGYDLGEIQGGRIFFEALLLSLRTNLPLLARQEDRNAMAHGLDLCAPFMDEELVQVALAFPFHRYMEGGQNKAILREATRDLLAPEVSSHPRKFPTPGSDPYLAFEVLRQELPDLLSSAAFRDSGIWSRRCSELYAADAARGARGYLWFRVFMVHQWYERVVRANASESLP